MRFVNPSPHFLKYCLSSPIPRLAFLHDIEYIRV